MPAPHHKQTPKKTIITVKDINNTFVATWDGEKSSCTASYEMAARRLMARVFGLQDDEIVLQPLPEKRVGICRYAFKQ